MELDPDEPAPLPRAPGYAFEALLGVGGMGHVYRARQLATGRAVAAKVLRQSLGDDSGQRLLAEASAIARLKHRNVVEMLDLARTEPDAEGSGRPMIALELVDGGDLEPWIDTFPGWPALERAVGDVLRGLAAAHGAQLVHADLKPSNLLLARDGSVKISDFGIARWQNPLRGTPGPDAISGTPEYMAPEQLLPDGHVGPWTDLYALGVMLYEWLGVRTPFSDCEDLPSLMRRKLTLEAPPPIEPKPGVLVPAALDALARQLIAPEPRDRPRFAAQLRQAFVAATPTPDDDAPSRDSEPPISWFPSAHDPSLALPTTLPLIGRGKERRFLENQIRAVQDRAKPRLVLLRGPAGIGKSHLALWAFGEVERRGWMEGLAAGFDFEGGAHGDGLRHALRRLLGAPAPGSDPFAGPWRWLAGSSREDDAAAAPPFDAREVLAWIGADRGFTSPERAAALGARVLRAASRVRPVYLWLDDLLWSRDGGAELVDALLAADDAAVLVVGTVRAGTADHVSVRARLDRWLAHPATSYIRLGELGAQERAELAAAVLPLDPAFAEEVGRELAALTPLELVQSLAHWFERGWLEGAPGEVRPAAGHGLASLRLATRDLFDERLRGVLQRTPDVVERTLICGALLGDPIESEVLYAALPDPREVVEDAIEWALLRGLWRSMPGGAMRFDHGLLRTAAFDRLMHRADAARLQRQAADGIAAVHDLDVPAVGLRVSELQLAAGEYAAASATLLKTASAVARAGALDRAHEIWMGMAEWLERVRDPRAHCDHRLLSATLAYHAGRMDTAARAAERALADAEALDDPPRRASARLLMAHVAHHRGDYARSEALAAELAELGDTPAPAPSAARVAALAELRLAELAALREDFAQAQAHHARAEALAPAAGERALVHQALTLGAQLALVAGDPDRAEARWLEALDSLRAVAGSDALPDVLALGARVKWARGRLAEAEAEAEARVREVRSLGDPHRLSGALITLALVRASRLARPAAEAAGPREPSGAEDEAPFAGTEAEATDPDRDPESPPGTAEADLADTLERLLEAFADAPHEGPFEVWGLLALAERLDAAGLDARAAEVQGLIEARRRRVSASTPSSAGVH